ncbi:hypothetical protein jhhlp_008665 [Lomentospora prolificans]|uniref:RING-type domain-containing protein n=1 Tax=Lomentospora prolificans TaxID=41688 RepID=A0A2N3MYN6_9PEZI|nr:hypothetical protein jhhlp_008665 [Lomentospora prolificans]
MSRVVKEHIGVIILGVFIVVAVIAPACCIIWARRRERRKYHPSSKSFRQARSKLVAVAEYRKDTEKYLGGGDAEWTGNCPICIGSLTAETNEPTAESATTGTAPPVTESSAQDASGSSKEITAVATTSTAQPSSGGGTGGGAVAEAFSEKEATGCSPIMRAVTRWLPLRLKRCQNQPERDAEIMKLKSCGHWFHARCLASWFLIDRYDCPVCRKTYFEGKPRSQFSTWLQTNYNINTMRVGAGTVV